MKRIVKSLTLIIALAMVLAVLPMSALAEGSYYVDTSYLVLNPGETGYITITADNAAGRVDVTASGNLTIADSDKQVWLDNGQRTIEVTANSSGTGSIQVVPVSMATYDDDDEELTYGFTIQVEVAGDVNEEAAPAEDTAAPAEEEKQEETKAPEEETTTEKKEEAAPADSNVLTDGNNDYENLSEEERLYTTVDGQQLYIIRYPLMLNDNGDTVWNAEVNNLDRLNGFELEKVNYKGVEIDSFSFKNLVKAFVLKNLETDECGYYTLGENGFTKLTYVTANGKQYIVVDFDPATQVPAGYQIAELTLGNNKIKALKKSSNELKGYEVKTPASIESVDPSADICYIYCLVNGEKQVYSYDSGEGTLQRAAILEYKEIPVEPETVIVYEESTVEVPVSTVNDHSIFGFIGLTNPSLQLKVLVAGFGLAIVLIIILIICLIASGAKNRKLFKKLSKVYGKNGKNKGAKRGKTPERKAETRENDDTMFSYVKTEKEEESFELEDFD